MNANALPLLSIFEGKRCFEVPFFQRQYVWNKNIQWEPLWEDISRKFTEYIDGLKDAPVHFLGAMVLDQKQTPTTHVERRQIIDGQQRLITIQIFMAALRDFCKSKGYEDLADECSNYINNKGMMVNPDEDKFKVLPTRHDRSQFRDVIESCSLEELLRKHPLRRRKYARKYDSRPRMVEAYIYFYNSIHDYFNEDDMKQFTDDNGDLSKSLTECIQALRNSLHVAIIDLDQDDDAQIIFETLNARGEPLLSADLLRNYIFLRAGRNMEPQEELYEQYWQKFDDSFWRKEIRQGRLIRPRSDLFMQHFLASRRGVDIPIKHLYVEYKWWIEKSKPFGSVREELSILFKNGESFKRIIEPDRDDILFAFSSFLRRFDIGTVYPLLLFLVDADIVEIELLNIVSVIESYLIRRAVCGYTTKGYNRIFLAMLRNFRDKGITASNAYSFISGLEGESVEFPRGQKFLDEWQNKNVYETLNHNKLVYILKRINDALYNTKMENILIESQLTVEHILPQTWVEKWLLPDGSRGMTQNELWDALEQDVIAIATRQRNSKLHSFGNLTILTQPLNSSLSNASWDIKKPELLKASLLPINQMLHSFEVWDENAIENRSKILFDIAVKIWPEP